MSKSNFAIIYAGDDDNSYCGSCDYLLYERKDGSMVCSNGECGRIYSPDAVTKHKSKLSPDVSRYDPDGPEIVPITGYTDMKRKNPTPGEIEDRMFASRKSGLSITSAEEWLPDTEDRDRK